MIRYMIANFALLTAFLFLFNHLLRNYLKAGRRTLPFRLLIGALHGCCALLLLLFSFPINETTFVDFRHLLVISSAYFGGLPASVTTALFVACGRTTLLGEWTSSSVIALVSITLAGIGSGLIMQYVKQYWRSWIFAILNSIAIITIISLIRGIRWETFTYSVLVCLGGLFTATLISFFTSANRLSMELEQSENRYRSLHSLQEAIFQSAAGAAITVMDCRGQITHANKATERMLGYTADELIGKQSFIVFHDPDEVNAYGKELAVQTGAACSGLEALLHSAQADDAEGGEWTYIRKDGARLTVWLTFSPLLLDGRTEGFIGIATDISQRKRMEEKLKHLSLLDGLTGIANRRFFDETLKQEWQNALQQGYENGLSLILMDIDNFKAYNDLYGHQAGDDCLRKVTAIAQKTLNHPMATIARYGGEEFAVILPNTNAERAAECAEELRHAVENGAIPHQGSRIGNVVTISIGVSTFLPAPDNMPEKLIAQADEALYHSKSHGRNRVTVYGNMNIAAPRQFPSSVVGKEV